MNFSVIIIIKCRPIESQSVTSLCPHQLHYCPHLLESSLHSGGGTHPGLQCHHHFSTSGENETMSVEGDTTMLSAVLLH